MISSGGRAIADLDDSAYVRYRDLVMARTGLWHGEKRRDALARGILEAMPRAGCADPAQYWNRLQSNPTDSALWDDLIQNLTIGETYFFRDPEQIDALRRHILPELIQRHQQDRQIKLWSAGCATGEEPYTVAMLLREALADVDQWRILILATDINRRALEQAAVGMYRAWSLRRKDAALTACMIQHGETYEVRREVREMVTFAYLNLAESCYPSPFTRTEGLDVILCRNVVIYLPEAVICQAGQRFYRCLVPGGRLMVAPSEANAAFFPDFQAERLSKAIVYQKPAAARAPAAGMAVAALPASPARPGLPAAPLARARPAQQSRRLSDLAEAAPRPADGAGPDSRDAGAICQRARGEANAGRLSEAARWANIALERDPMCAEAHYLLALIAHEEGQMERAADEYKKALYLNPTFVLAHFGLSGVCDRLGFGSQAARHRAQAIRLAARLAPDSVLPGSDDVTARRLLALSEAAR